MRAPLAAVPWLLGALAACGIACGARTPLEVWPNDAGPDAIVDAGPPNVPCAAAKGQTLVLDAATDPTALAIDEAYAYWYDKLAGAIVRIGKKGGTVQTIVSQIVADVYFMAVDATDVYWTSGIAGHLWRAPKIGGGTPVTLGIVVASGGIALDATNVYWSDGGTQILKMPKAGGASSALATNQAQPQGVAADDSFVYWANGIPSNALGIERAPIATGGPQPIADVRYGSHVALDATYVYWTQQDNGHAVVARAPKAGGATQTLAPGQKPSGIVVDDAYVWWTDFEAGTVSRTGKDGVVTATIASGQSLARELAGDAACLFWTTENADGSGGSVVAYAK